MRTDGSGVKEDNINMGGKDPYDIKEIEDKCQSISDLFKVVNKRRDESRNELLA